MYEVRRFLTSIALLTLIASCATQAPPPAPAPAVIAPPPNGSLRLPGVLACESEIGCVACSDDDDKARVRMAPYVHAAEVRACYDRGDKSHGGASSRVVFRIGIDPTGTVGTSCVVRSSLNDANIEGCLADLVMTWKFPPPKSGNWALVDNPFVFTR